MLFKKRAAATLEEVIHRSNLFNIEYYLARYPQVASSKLSPLDHFVKEGADLGYFPNRLFDPAYYKKNYPEVGGNALYHYIMYGALEGRNTCDSFNTRIYEEYCPEAKQQGINPLAHYLSTGAAEGRLHTETHQAFYKRLFPCHSMPPAQLRQILREEEEFKSLPAYSNWPANPEANSRTVLNELREKKEVWNLKGERGTSPNFVVEEEGEILYNLINELKPAVSMEIGLMHAYSSMYMMQAMAENNSGILLSMDPGQFREVAEGIGLMNIRRSNHHTRHLHWKEYSQYGLPTLCKEGAKFDFAFLDGIHLYDYNVLEFFYVDKMLAPGAAIVFHDYGYPAVFTALEYIETNFPYTVEPCKARNLRVLRKQANDTRPWYYHKAFQSAQISWTKPDNLEYVNPADYPRPASL